MSDIQTPSPPDRVFVAAFRSGNKRAFADIYDRYAGVLFSGFLAGGASRDEAADATHDTFLEAAARMGENDPPEDLGPWLQRIASEVGNGWPGAEKVDPESIVPAPPALRPRVLNKVERDEAAAPVTIGAPAPDWVKMGMFAIVTVVLGLLGLAVSAQFEPLPALPTTPVTQPPIAAPSTTATSTPGDQVSTTAPQGEPSSTAAAGTPAAITVSTEPINFGGDGTVGQVEIRNTGGQAGAWALASSTPAIALSAGRGELAPGESVIVEMSLDREEIGEGDIEQTLTMTWSGGQVVIPVVGSHEDNPIIHNPQASPPSVQVSGAAECSNTQTTISARIKDSSPLESVVVRWSPNGGTATETPMNSVGNDMFEGVVGPFTTVHTAEVRIVAFDERGNAGGATTSVAVVACP